MVMLLAGMRPHVDTTSHFFGKSGVPSLYFGMCEARHFKFIAHIDHVKSG